MLLRLPSSTTVISYIDLPCSDANNKNPPVLLSIAPWGLDYAFMLPQINDQRLRSSFRIICANLRSHGAQEFENNTEYSAKYDDWVQAADFILLMDTLSIASYSILATSAVSSSTAVLMTLLFPNQITTLVLVGVIGMTALPDAALPCREVIECWKEAEDVEEYFEGIAGLTQFYDCPEFHANAILSDDIIRTFIRRYNPANPVPTCEITKLSQYTTGVTKAQLATISVPIYMLHGSTDCWVLNSEAELLKSELSGSIDVRLEVLPGPHMVGIVFPELINDHIIPFLQQYSTPPINSTGKLDYNRALELITTIGSGDKLSRKEVLSRNVKDPNSYSAWGEAEIAVFQSKIDNYKKKASESNFDEELLKVIGKNSEPGFGQVVEEEDSHRWEWSKRRLFKAGTSTVCHLDDLEEEFQVKLELDH